MAENKLNTIHAAQVGHLNGGIEQAFLQLAAEDNLLSEADKQRLEYLKSLPQARYEYNGKITEPKP